MSFRLEATNHALKLSSRECHWGPARPNTRSGKLDCGVPPTVPTWPLRELVWRPSHCDAINGLGLEHPGGGVVWQKEASVHGGTDMGDYGATL